MKVIVDKSMAALGITDVVYAVGRGLDPQAELTDALKQVNPDMEFSISVASVEE